MARNQSVESFNQRLCKFLDASPTSFHATRELIRWFESKGYVRLWEKDHWELKKRGRYYIVRNDSSLAAFQIGDANPAEAGFRIVGAHTDSPCLKIKPNSDIRSHGYHQLGVEIYGGVLLSTWFDRDLSIAGRASFRTRSGKVEHVLIDFKKPIATLPNLAIHLNREVNDKKAIQRQLEMNPILSLWTDSKTKKFHDLMLDQIKADGHRYAAQVLDHEMSLYDTQPAARVGLHGEFISSSRLDNLLSVFAGANAAVDASYQSNTVFIAHDHEEVGSVSYHGADGPFARTLLERLAGDSESFHRAVDRSFFISTDNAHGIHPNYPDRHDPLHAPMLNRGPVVKVNVSQRYATNSETGSHFMDLCDRANVPYQKFVSRNDQPCGSTIGPLSSRQLGIRTVDVGVPTFAMHSIRELAGSEDSFSLYKVLKEFFVRI
jgi:aspartyl aminopeptidase